MWASDEHGEIALARCGNVGKLIVNGAFADMAYLATTNHPRRGVRGAAGSFRPLQQPARPQKR